MSIKHLFFDLDRTLWDFETNSFNELVNLYHCHNLHQKGISLSEEFVKVYKKINEKCWERYRENTLSKENLRFERFKQTLEYFGIYDLELSIKIGDDYVKNSPYRTILIPNAIELLSELQPNYKLHIITNGFQEVQHVKINQSGMAKFFTIVVTSEMAGAKKPNPLIFNYALEKAGANLENSVMIGDDLNTDIKGAVNVGMKSIYFNPNKRTNNSIAWKEVVTLMEIKDIFL
ncbi:MAG: YjjG family noncanonical pyrimidine nucleotidase [Flavobacteriales bacterium]|tara:strand:- start:3190 stop:3885 length:696 start_codon:yes stop_codon:yes gene_type:complete